MEDFVRIVDEGNGFSVFQSIPCSQKINFPQDCNGLFSFGDVFV